MPKPKVCSKCGVEYEHHSDVRCPFCGHHLCAHQTEAERAECREGKARMARARRPEDRWPVDWEALNG